MPFENELELIGPTGSIALTTDGRRLLVSGSDASYPGATILVASSNSSKKAQRAASYVCDGVEDAVEINEALASLPISTRGTVLVAEGDYTLGNTGIQFLSGNSSITGTARRGSAVIGMAPGSTLTKMVQVGTSGTGNLFNNSISKLAFDGSNGTNVTCIAASSNIFEAQDLYIASVANMVALSSFTTTEFAFQRLIGIDGFAITNDGVSTDANINDLRCEEVTVGGVFNTTGRYGFNLSGPYPSLIGCRAYDFASGWGVFLQGAFMADVQGGHFDENGKLVAGGGIHADSTSRVSINGSKFNSNDSYDVYFSNTSNSSIRGIQANGAGTKGPSVCSINIAGCTYVVAADNNLVDMQTRGLVLSSSTQCSVHDNMISNPTAAATQASIRVFAANHNHIHHNTVSNGISEESTSDFNSFDRNNLAGGSMTKVGANSAVTAFP